MKTFTTALALLVASTNADILGRAACAANNCARAVTGTANLKPPVSSRLADCSSFFSVTVTPATFTSTVATSTVTTITDTSVQPGPTTTVYVVAPPEEPQPVPVFPDDKRAIPFGEPALVRRVTTVVIVDPPVTQTATAIPTYASACTTGGASVAYSSACSCFGALAATTIAPAPTAANTVTITTSTLTMRETVYPTAPLFVKFVEVCAVANNFDYIYEETQGAGALLTPPIAFSGLDRHDCCAKCYSTQYSADCAGTVYDELSGTCSLYRTSGGFDMTERCPSGRGSVFDQPGIRVQLGPCGRTRAIGASS